MALLSNKNLGDETEIGLWKIEEPEYFFVANLHLHPLERKELEKMKGARRTEWLASRYLVHMMLVDLGHADLEERTPVLKDEFGKPHLDGSGFHISFSHSHGLVAVLLSKSSAGIDIQRFVSKITFIAHKFMRAEELESIEPASRLEHLHVYWGAKEALYKAYGRRELDFRQHILVEPFVYTEPALSFNGTVCKNDFYQTYDMKFEKAGDFFLVWALATDR